MFVEFEKHESSQVERPSEVDALSSATKVYIRKNIERVAKEDIETGEVYELWQYDEAIITHAQYEQMLTEGLNNVEESNEELSETMDAVLSEAIPEQAAQIEELSEAIDDILTNVIPGMMEV